MRRTATFCAALLLLAGCGGGKRGKTVSREWPAMGTVAGVTLRHGDRCELGDVVDAAQMIFNRLESELSLFRPDSSLSLINERAGRGPATSVYYPFAGAIECAATIARRSGSAFDPTIGPLMTLWGFRDVAVTSPPPPEAVAAALAQTGVRYLSRTPVYFYDQVEVRLEQPGMKLDLGGIAKGLAVDLVWENLEARGIEGALVNLGGNIRVLGAPSATRKAWRLAIQHPFDRGATAQTLLLEDGEAVATSGDYERFVTLGGVRYAHIIDGRTGRPVTHTASVTVVAPTAMEADALSTTLFVLGPDEGMRFLETWYPEADALWITSQPGSRTVMSPGMAQRLP